MAVANVAEILCRQGLRVLMVDFDLEAPGLEQYCFTRDSREHEQSLCARGLIDMLVSYKELRQLPVAAPTSSGLESNLKQNLKATGEAWAAELAALFPDKVAAKNTAIFDKAAPVQTATHEATHAAMSGTANERKRFDYPVEPLSNFIFHVYREGEVNAGALMLLPAGRRRREDVAAQVATSDASANGGSSKVSSATSSSASAPFQKASGSSSLASEQGSHETNGDEPAASLVKDEFANYAQQVRSFAWDEFYLKWDGEAFFEWFREQAAQIADVVLIDSRTGVTEMGGVCTHQLADVVVMFVAMNEQNIDGAWRVATSLTKPEVVEGRDGRELSLLFVPSRVDSSEGEFLDQIGRRFKKIFSPFVPARIKFTDDLFADLKVPYRSYYSFTDEVAARDPLSPKAVDLVKAFENVINTLVQFEPPHSRFRQAFNLDDTGIHVLAPEEVYARRSPDAQRLMRVVLMRLVQVASPEDGDGAHTTFLRVSLKSFSDAEQSVVEGLAEQRLLTIERDIKTNESVVRVTDENAIMSWKRFADWIVEDGEFLVWRQQTKANIEQWRANKQDESFLLIGKALELGESWKESRGAELTDSEVLFISESARHDERKKQSAQAEQARQQKRRRVIGAGLLTGLLTGLIAVVVLGIVWQQYKRARAVEQSASFVESGDKSFENGDYAEAIDFYSRATTAKPDFANAYVLRGNVYLRQQQFDDAARDYEDAITHDGNLAEAYNGRGLVALKRTMEANQNSNADLNTVLDAAIKDFNRALSLKNDYAEAYLNRASAYRRQQNTDRALADLTLVLEIKNDYAEAFFERAGVYAETNRYEQAAADYRNAVRFATIPLLQTNAQSALDELVNNRKVTSVTAEPTSLTTPATPRIFVHYNDPDDLDLAQQIAENVRRKFPDVPGIELRGEATNGDVRYFYAEEEANAQAVRDIVSSTLAARGREQKIITRFFGRLNRNVPRGQLEIWLPSLKNSSYEGNNNGIGVGSKVQASEQTRQTPTPKRNTKPNGTRPNANANRNGNNANRPRN